MPTRITWLGHACWQVQTEATTLLIDPFLTGNPAAAVQADKVEADTILISHGHGDHVGDTVAIAQRTGATVISNYEICAWLAGQGVQKTIGGNLGGGVNLSWGRVQLTLAHHSSQLPDGSYGGNPSGFLITLGKQKLYFACDTGLFYDMQLIGARGIDVAVLPIGDLFTMGPDDALEAVKLIAPKYVLPSHFNTWPPISQDPNHWAERVKAETKVAPTVLKSGETFTLPD